MPGQQETDDKQREDMFQTSQGKLSQEASQCPIIKRLQAGEVIQERPNDDEQVLSKYLSSIINFLWLSFRRTPTSAYHYHRR